MREALFGVGAAFEFVGIILVGSPDFFPAATRVSAWLRVCYRRTLDRVRRWLRRPRHQVVQVSGAESISVAGSVSVVKSVNPQATLEERTAFLVTRDQEAQRDVNELRERIATLERESPQRLDEFRRDMEEHVARELTAALETYRPLRVSGGLALAVGLACVAVAAFL